MGHAGPEERAVPSASPALNDTQRQSRCAGTLRAHNQTITEQSLASLAEVDAAYRTIPQEYLRSFIAAYLAALAEAVEQGGGEPFDRVRTQARDLLSVDGVGVAGVIRALEVVGDRCRAATSLPDDVELVRHWTREATALITERAVSTVTQQLEDELSQHRLSQERLLSLQRVSTAVLSELSLDRILQVVVDEAMQLMDAAAAAIRLVDDDGTTLRRITSTGAADTLLSAELIPIEGSLVGQCFVTRRPIISNDVQHDQRLSGRVRARSALQSLLIVPLIVRERAIGVLLVADRARGTFSPEDQRLLSLFADQASTAIEHARLYRQAQAQVAELAALQRISSVISSSLDIDEVFRALYDEIRGVMTADALIIGLARDNGRFDLDFIMDDGQRYAPRHDFTFSPAMNQSVIEKRAMIIDDVHSPKLPRLHTIGHPETRVRSIVNAPLLKGDEVVGLLSAQSYTPNTYKPSDAQLLMTIANNAVVAIEHARLYAQAQTLAVAEERNRLAREIHDTLAQGLIGISLYLERLDLALEGGDGEQRDLVQRALNLTRANLEEARRSVRDLRAAPLEGRTLIEALTHLVQEIHGEGTFAVDLRVPSSVPMLAARVETALFRMVQESVTNCRKHAQCSQVTIELRLNEDDLALSVIDDGLGFDTAAARAKVHRCGLASMQERIVQIGGQLEIESHVGDGTTIRACLPIARALARDDEHVG
jgi:two-component system NarL family sensor kinase